MCIVTGAECAMNLFGIADMQLTRGKVVVGDVDPLHHRKHILTEGHTLIPPSVGGLRMLHLCRQNFGSSYMCCTHKFMIMFNEVIITNKSSQSFIPDRILSPYLSKSHAGLVNCKEYIYMYIYLKKLRNKKNHSCGLPALSLSDWRSHQAPL